MTDVEKVVKGLERCLVCDISVVASPEGEKAYRDCEYTVGLYCKQKNLMRDAIKLIKEQQKQKTIVQCKDCKHCNKERIDRNMIWCNLHNFARPEFYFCADGINDK